MSAFTTQTPHAIPQIEAALNRVRAVARGAREAATPPGASARTVERASIEELNSLDLDTIRERFYRSRRDDRPGWLKAIDLLDASRNAWISRAFPAIEKRKRLAGDVGAGGQGKVFGSDILQEMGVSNKVVRGIGGFAFDVATDPLILLGPVGGGARILTGSGRVVRVVPKFTRQVKAAEKAVQAGREVAPGPVKSLLEAAGKADPAFKPSTAKGGLRAQVLGGPPVAKTRIGRALQKVGRLLPAERESVGGIISKGADDFTLATETAAVRAAREPLIEETAKIIRQYGVGASPGIRIGRNKAGKLTMEIAGRGPGKVQNATSTILHVPLTDIGLHVPGFTAAGKAATSAQVLARAGMTGLTPPESARLTEARRLFGELGESLASREAAAQAERAYREANAGAVLNPERAGIDVGESVKARLEQFKVEREAMIAREIKLAQDIADVRRTMETGLPENADPASMLAMTRERDAMDAVADLTAIEAAPLFRDVMERRRLVGAEKERLGKVSAFFDRLASLDEVERGQQHGVRSFLGIDQTGATVLNADPAVQASVRVRAEPLLDEYESALRELTTAERPSATQPLFHTDAPIGADEAARARVADLRQQLLDVTEPLRTGQPNTLDQFREAVRARDLALLDDTELRLLNLSESDAALMEEQVDALNRKMGAALNVARTVEGSALTFLNRGERDIANISARFLGTTDGIVGTAVLAPLVSAAELAAPHDAGVSLALAGMLQRGKRAVFGSREGSELKLALRWGNNQTGHEARRVLASEFSRRVQAIETMADTAKVPRSELPRLYTLATALAAREAERRTGRIVFATKKFGSDEPTDFWRMLDEAVKSGFLNEKLYPGLPAALNDFAAKNVDILHELAGFLDPAARRAGYFPNIPTGGAEELMAGQRAQALGTKTAQGVARAKNLEAFEKSRTHDQARFLSHRTGKEEGFFEADRWVTDLTDGQIALMENAADRTWIQELRAVIDEYDKLPDRPRMMATDPFEMNRLVSEGRFARLLGTSSVPGGFMDTNLASAMANRLAQHERALGRSFLHEYRTSSVGLNVSADAVNKHIHDPTGTPIDLGNGAQGTLVRLGRNPNGSQRVGIRVGSDVFRPIDARYRNDKTNEFIDWIGPENAGELYHEHVAEGFERLASLFNPASEDINPLLRGFDVLTRAWKTVTLMHPSWFIFNIVGDSLNAWMSDPMFPVNAVKDASPVARMLRLAPDQLAASGIRLDVPGVGSPAELVQTLYRDRILDNNIFMDAPAHLVARGLLTFRSRLRQGKLADVFQALGKQPLRTDFEDLVQHMRLSGESMLSAKAKATGYVATDRMMRTFVEPWFRVNMKTQNFIRTLAYLSHRRSGMDHGQAVARTLRAMVDYQDFTRVEQTVLRRMFPFYSWVRGNGAYQVKMLLERPIFAGSLPLVHNAIEEAISGENRVPPMARPNWMKQQLALQIGAGEDTRQMLMLSSALPQEQALVALSGLFGGVDGLQDAGHYIASSINPVIRAPFEFSTGREIFSGREIGALGDISATRFAAEQIRPIREISKIARLAREGQFGSIAGRALVGGRLQPGGTERLASSKRREFEEEEKKLRSMLRRAERDGNTKERARVNLRLLLLYRDMETAGLGQDVPRWARKRVAELAETP